MHHAQGMLAAAKALGDPQSLGFAHLAMAFAWEDRGDLSRAAAAYAETKALWHDVGGIYTQAQLGNLLILQGDLEAGVPMVDEALTYLRELANPPWWVVLVINLRGHAALRQQDRRRAACMFAEALDSDRELHHTQGLLSSIAGLAGVALARGHARRAAWLLGAVEAARQWTGIKRINNWQHVEHITADVRAALPAVTFEEAWSAGGAEPLEEAVTEAIAIADETDTIVDSCPRETNDPDLKCEQA
jgi:hypothetical protein